VTTADTVAMIDSTGDEPAYEIESHADRADHPSRSAAPGEVAMAGLPAGNTQHD
jgi:hypothetical protein